MGNFDMLPGEIVFNILTRLPAELVLECKLVSKSWNKVVSYPSFSQTHLDRCLEDLDSGGKSTFLLVNDDFVFSSFSYRKFHYLEYQDDSSLENPPFYRVKRMKINPAPYMYYYLAGACNGLICLNGCLDNDWVNYEPVYICNPITRECVYLPVFERTLGLLADSHGTDCSLDSVIGKGWRNLQKKFNKKLDSFKCVRGVFVNESLYWNLKSKTGNIVAFDLANEIFVEIPKAFPSSSNYVLGVLGGYLSAVHYDKYSKTSELLLLKKKEEDGSLSWIKEFTLSNTDTHQSLALSCRGTVLCHSGTKVPSS
ncbi:F-box/kelch-repeat protein At3g06240-like [Papaver somniferum]|uniref:F-box/kelch-repeat protein At3g06240-like n=1 Tax=Papaver somniferum TaxID=3469 RepID=UPI000E6FA2B2|nr:F-box/kelch-repeat protein At3g06240-like [Papaver somniferum]